MLVVVSSENGYGMGGNGVDWWWCLLEGNNLKNGEKFIAGKEKGRGVGVRWCLYFFFTFFYCCIKRKMKNKIRRINSSI